MILVRGDNEDTVWRARVLSFRMRRQDVSGCFFRQRPDRLWEPERTRNQQIMFVSILGIGKGYLGCPVFSLARPMKTLIITSEYW